MTKSIKNKGGIFLVLLMFCSFIFGNAAMAEQTALSEAEESIVKIRINYEDDEDNKYLVREGTGFLIGEEGAQSVVTSKKLIEVSNKELKTLRKDNEINEEEELRKRVEIIAANDVTIEAEIRIDSADLGCVVFTLSSPLYNKKSLELGDSDVVQTEQSVYTLEMKEETEEIVGFAGKVLELGKTVGSTSYIVHTVKGQTEYFGSPLLNPTGDVIGVCVNVDEAGNLLAIPIKALREVLDVMGVAYGKADSKYYLLKETVAEGEEILLNSKKYAEDSLASIQVAVEEAKAVLDSKEATENHYEEAIVSIEEAKKELVTKAEKMRPVQIGLGVVIGILLVADIVLAVTSREKKPKIQYMKEPTKEDKQVDFDATVALGEAVKIPQAYLVKGGERTLVSKMVFRVGKSYDQADFIIEGNKSVSRHHADIVCENGFFFVIDRGSLNHTMVNGEMLVPNKKKAVRNRDKIKFANEEYVFEIKE